VRSATSWARREPRRRNVRARRAPGAARRHRLGQDLHGGQRHRPREPADLGHGAQQDAGGAALSRVQGPVPDNAVEYFVSYYDYYQPEAYVPSDRHLHREGLVDQRRDRQAAPLGHPLAARPRDVLVVASVSCIYGLGAPEPTARCTSTSRRASAARPRRFCAGWSTCSTSATTSTSTAAPSGCAATSSRSSRSTRTSARSASSSSATRSRRSPRSTRCAARWCAASKSALIYPASHYVTPPRHPGAPSRASARSCASGSASCGRGQAARGAAARAAHPLRPRDARGDGLLPRRRELLALARRPRRRAAALHALRLLSRRTSCWSSTRATSPCRRSAACTAATAPARRRWSSSASGCPRRSTTGRSLRRVRKR
jgi:hypothetical protein